MGTPKPELRFGNESLLEHAVRVIGEAVQPVVIVLAPEQQDPSLPGVAVVRDEEVDGGPLVGALAGLEWLSRHGVKAGFVTACDMPFLTSEVVQMITAGLRDAEVAAPMLDGRWHPLAAVYSTSLVPRIRERLEAGRRSLVGLIEDSKHRAIDSGALMRADPHGLALVNINTPDQYEAALTRLKSSDEARVQNDGGSIVRIRPARPEDAEAISQLETVLAETFITPEYSSTGASVLLESLSPDETRERMNKGVRYHVAVANGQIVGVAALIPRGHLYHLFVADSHHKQGIAKRLWEVVRDEALASGNPGRITVNSSRYAIPFYERLGFVKDGGIAEKNEVTCQPMVWQIAPPVTDEEDRLI
jgi:molybdenum cofactor guanylyltransferase